MSIRVTEYLAENDPVGPTETVVSSKPHALASRVTHSVRSSCDGEKSEPETVTTCPSTKLADGDSEIVGAEELAPMAADVSGIKNKTTKPMTKPLHRGLVPLRIRSTPASQPVESIRMGGRLRRSWDPGLPWVSSGKSSPDEWPAYRPD
jgi:hypothetical protein